MDPQLREQLRQQRALTGPQSPAVPPAMELRAVGVAIGHFAVAGWQPF
jgi:hypothetical protein